MFVKVKGLVTRETRYRDNDKLLTVVTADGRLTVRARGVMRIRSPLASGCQLYAYSAFTLFENRGLLSVNAAEPIELFMGLRTDALKLALAAYFSDIAEKISDSDAESGELLRLTLNCLYALGERDVPPELVRAGFEMRAAKVAGYEPQLDVCLRCGNPPETPYISPLLGGVCCRRCLPVGDDTGALIPCPAGVLPLLRSFLTAPLKRLLPPVDDVRLIGDAVYVTERYLFAQLDCSPKLLHYYKSFRSPPSALQR